MCIRDSPSSDSLYPSPSAAASTSGASSSTSGTNRPFGRRPHVFADSLLGGGFGLSDRLRDRLSLGLKGRLGYALGLLRLSRFGGLDTGRVVGRHGVCGLRTGAAGGLEGLSLIHI